MQYEEPRMKVLMLYQENIIRTSGTPDLEVDPDEGDFS